MSSNNAFHHNDSPLQQLQYRQQQPPYQERTSSIGTDEFDVVLGSDMSHPGLCEEDIIPGSAVTCPGDVFKPISDNDGTGKAKSQVGEELLDGTWIEEEQDIELLLYSDDLLPDDKFGGDESVHAQSLSASSEYHREYAAQRSEVGVKLLGPRAYETFGRSGSGSVDLIHKHYFDDRDNERNERGCLRSPSQDRVASSPTMGVHAGEIPDEGGEREKHDAQSSSSVWESIRSCDLDMSDYDLEENNSDDVPDLWEDMIHDAWFGLLGYQEETLAVAPPNSFEPGHRYNAPPPKHTPSCTTKPSTATAHTPAVTAEKTPKFMTTTEQPREWVLEKLESMACRFLHDLSIGEPPVVELACRNRADVIGYDEDVGVIHRRTAYFRVDEERTRERQVQVVQKEEKDVGEDETGDMMPTTASSGKRQREVEEAEQWPRRRRMKDGQSPLTTLDNKTDGDGTQEPNASATHNPSTTTTSSPSPSKYPQQSLSLSSSPSSPFFTKRHPFSTKRASRTLRVAELLHENLSKGTISSKRDLFYRDVLSFGSQPAVDSIVEDLACTLEVPRECLNVVAGSRSVVFGSVRILIETPGRRKSDGGLGRDDVGGGGEKESGEGEGELEWLQEDIADSPFAKTLRSTQSPSYKPSYSKGKDRQSNYEEEYNRDDPLDSGFSQTSYNTLVPIPVRFADIVEIEIHPRTRFVLVIEKEATFGNLISLGFCESHGPCILLTSKGFPDQVARRLLKVISDMVQEGVFVKKLRRSGTAIGGTAIGGICGSGRGRVSKSLLMAKAPRSSPPSVRVSQPLQIPLLALVDCDPHGIEIYLVYRCGSVASAYDNANLAVPELKCLGQVPSDWDVILKGRPPPPSALPTTITNRSHDRTLQEHEEATNNHEQAQKQALAVDVSEDNEEEAERLRARFLEAFIPLTKRDRRKLERLLTGHPYIRQHARWKEQIVRMLELNGKTEIQSLHLSHGHGFGSVADVAGYEDGTGISVGNGGGRGRDGDGDG
ncbi:endodeoxyribonuclease, partial [Linnemannia exigua]